MRQIAGLIAAVVFLGLVSAVPAQEENADGPAISCGDQPVTIARMQWPSAAILAHIHAQILSQNMGCEVQVVAGDLGATTSSLATTGAPDVAPELWLGRVAPIWNSAVEGQQVRQAGPTFSGGPLEAWFVPRYVVENNPGLASIQDVLAHWQVFAEPGASRAKFVSCPSEWGCAVINANLIRALKLDARFDVLAPENRFALDKNIGDAVSKRQPILFYYWQPNAIVSQLDLVALDMGAFDANAVTCLANRNCPAPQPSAFAPEQVVIAVAERLFTDVPSVAGYFQKATMPIAAMNALLAWQNEQGATAEDTAAHFVAQSAAVWRPWLGQ